MTARLATERDFPWSQAFSGKSVSFSLMSEEDVSGLRAFARKLKAKDVLFLRMDIRQPEVLKDWQENIARGRTITVLARDEEKQEIIGYCSLHHNELLWTSHHGEIRVFVLDAYRGLGIGSRILGELFQIAREQHLERLIVNVPRDQPHIRKMLEHLGFHVEALLAEWLKSPDGQYHDMLIMSHFVEE